MTNPPFGSKIPIEDPAILESFDLGHTWSWSEEDAEWRMEPKLFSSQPPEILFIERCVRLLEPGVGVAALVIPNGILGNPGLGYVRSGFYATRRSWARWTCTRMRSSPTWAYRHPSLCCGAGTERKRRTARTAPSRITRCSWPSATTWGTTSADRPPTCATNTVTQSCGSRPPR